MRSWVHRVCCGATLGACVLGPEPQGSCSWQLRARMRGRMRAVTGAGCVALWLATLMRVWQRLRRGSARSAALDGGYQSRGSRADASQVSFAACSCDAAVVWLSRVSGVSDTLAGVRVACRSVHVAATAPTLAEDTSQPQLGRAPPVLLISAVHLSLPGPLRSAFRIRHAPAVTRRLVRHALAALRGAARRGPLRARPRGRSAPALGPRLARARRARAAHPRRSALPSRGAWTDAPPP
jgi:hypothetical protein